MSGLEVLGATAAAAQLAGYMIHITEALLLLRDHIKHAPIRFQTYTEQLESLKFTIQSIQDSQDHLTVIIEKPLHAISQRVDALNRLLNDSKQNASRPATARYIRIFAEKKNERHIRESFAALEGLKQNLGLCIAESNRKSLENLRTDLRARMPDTEVSETITREGSISSLTESTLAEESKWKLFWVELSLTDLDQLILHTTPTEVVRAQARLREASLDSSVTIPDMPGTAKESQSASTGNNCIMDGVKSDGNHVGGVGWGMSHGEIRNSSATNNFFGGIGPMGPEFLRLLMQANPSFPPSNTQNLTA